MDYNQLEKMISTMSVSGYEMEQGKSVIKEMEQFCDQIDTDCSGNVMGSINKGADQKILLCAHMDEIGLVVSQILPSGMLKVMNAGGIRAAQFIGNHVRIQSENGFIHGVCVTNRDLLSKGDIKAKDLMIDIGVDSYEEACAMVQVGNPIVDDYDLKEIGKSRIAGRALDDRMGVYILLEALRKAKGQGCKSGVTLAATVGEETTMRGAYFASEKIKPKAALIVDVTYATDYPGSNPCESGDVKLGKGPVICMSSTVNKALNKQLIECAKILKMNIQYEVAPGRTFTDGDKVHFSNEGVPQVLVSIPLRYMHSSVEMADCKDIDDCIDLIAQFLMCWDQVECNPYK